MRGLRRGFAILRSALGTLGTSDARKLSNVLRPPLPRQAKYVLCKTQCLYKTKQQPQPQRQLQRERRGQRQHERRQLLTAANDNKRKCKRRHCHHRHGKRDCMQPLRQRHRRGRGTDMYGRQHNKTNNQQQQQQRKD